MTIEEISLILLVAVVVLLGVVGLLDSSRIKWKKSSKEWERRYLTESKYASEVIQELQELRKKNR